LKDKSKEVLNAQHKTSRKAYEKGRKEKNQKQVSSVKDEDLYKEV